MGIPINELSAKSVDEVTYNLLENNKLFQYIKDQTHLVR